MKIFFLTILLPVFLLYNANNNLSAYDGSIRMPYSQSKKSAHSQIPFQLPWADSYEQAVEQARRTNQSIVLLFTGSDWCHWCKILERDFISNSSFVQALKGEFLFVRIEIPRSHSLPPGVIENNKCLMKRFNVSGLPSLVVLNAGERILGRSGYLQISPAQFASKLQAMRHTQF